MSKYTGNTIRVLSLATAFLAASAQAQLAQQTTTGVGNQASLIVEAGAPVAARDNTYVRPVQLQIRYEDVQGYFNGADVVQAYVLIRKQPIGRAAAGEPHAEEAMIQLNRVNQRLYVGTYITGLRGSAGQSGEELIDVALAFVSNGQWDSDFGRNYTFAINLRS